MPGKTDEMCEMLRRMKMNKTNIVVYDIETTGLDPEKDEILQVSVIDGDGNVLMNTYVKPSNHTEWPDAEAVHGITPEMVADAPMFWEISLELQCIFNYAKNHVSYNGAFDRSFLMKQGIDFGDAIQHDVMLEFAPIYGEWNDYRQDYKWQKLTKCAAYYGYEFKAHDSLEDVRATLYCWKKMHEKKEKFSIGKFVNKHRKLFRIFYFIFLAVLPILVYFITCYFWYFNNGCVLPTMEEMHMYLACACFWSYLYLFLEFSTLYFENEKLRQDKKEV